MYTRRGSNRARIQMSHRANDWGTHDTVRLTGEVVVTVGGEGWGFNPIESVSLFLSYTHTRVVDEDLSAESDYPCSRRNRTGSSGEGGALP